jgi:hypothetical protein
MKIHGRCHCGNIAFLFTVLPEPQEIAARACSCTFCLKHGGVWASSPAGSLRIDVLDPVQVHRYAFATRTADFHVCRLCGVVPLATSVIDGREYAVVNIHSFEDVPEGLLRQSSASFDGEDEASRLARRARNWTPVLPAAEHL